MSRILVAASLVFAASACGEIKTNQLADGPSGSGGDASSDGTAPGGKMQIQVLDPQETGAPVVGAPVVFIDSTGTQVGVSDGSGTAKATIADGASVTAIASEGGDEVLLQTVFGAKGADAIVLGDVFDGSDLGTFTVNFPTIAGIVADYTVFGPCGESGTVTTGTAQLFMQSSCKTDPMELIVVANSTAGVNLGSIDTTGVPFVANGSTTITGNYKAELSFAASYTDGGSGDGSDANVNLERFAPDDFGVDTDGGTTLANGMASLSVTAPIASTAVVETSIEGSDDDAEIVQRIDGNGTTYGLDISKTILPRLHTPAFDAATQTISSQVTTTDTSGDAPDFYFCRLQYSRAGSDGDTQDFGWLLFAAAPQDMVLPKLPGPLSTLSPLASDTIQEIACGSFESDAISGYDAARPNLYHVADELFEARNVTGLARESSSFFENVRVRAAKAIRAGSRAHSSRLLAPRGAARAR